VVAWIGGGADWIFDFAVSGGRISLPLHFLTGLSGSGWRASRFPAVVACALVPCTLMVGALMVGAIVLVPPIGALASTGQLTKLADRVVDPDARMLVEADELLYDRDRDSVAAVGNVQIYYNGYTLEAERITLYRRTSRLIAEGKVRLTEPDGNIVKAGYLVLSEDFKTGFVRSLQVETLERTRFTAERAERVGGKTTIFHNGSYTACGSCARDTGKPPTWEIKAKRIIHNQQERTISYESARLEMWGVPVAYLPTFSHADPTVKRKSGFLAPRSIITDKLGLGVSVPYFWAPAPNYDVTLTATPLSKQGVLGQLEMRHALDAGMYSVKLTGIHQHQPEKFAGTSGDRDWRGMFESKALFDINNDWTWGWDVTVASDRSFTKDYRLDGDYRDEAVSSIFLTGQSGRNFFDVRLQGFQVFQEDGILPYKKSLQSKQPYVHPTVDYNTIVADPVLNGELSFDLSLYAMTRDTTDARFLGVPVPRYYGIDGAHARATVELAWRRKFIAAMGSVITPFGSLRGDLFYVDDDGAPAPTLTTETFETRFTPTAGLDVRWPWISTAPWGSQIIEPIAQLVARPSESLIGELPNEDAQSLVFDDTSLFDSDKFTGFDRAAGGTRLNLGLQYRLMFDTGGYLSALLGQSYQLAGKNSFKQTGLVLTGADTGLETTVSDIVGRFYLDTNRGFRLGAQVRLDEDDFTIQRALASATGVIGPLVSSFNYSFLAKQPSLGIPDDRSELLTAMSLQVRDNWRLFGALRYDIYNGNFVRDAIGLAFDDESLSASISFAEDRSRANGEAVDRTIYFRLGLRTIGDGEFSSGLLQ
jgi:LPS-assembly protein